MQFNLCSLGIHLAEAAVKGFSASLNHVGSFLLAFKVYGAMSRYILPPSQPSIDDQNEHPGTSTDILEDALDQVHAWQALRFTLAGLHLCSVYLLYPYVDIANSEPASPPQVWSRSADWLAMVSGAVFAFAAARYTLARLSEYTIKHFLEQTFGTGRSMITRCFGATRAGLTAARDELLKPHYRGFIEEALTEQVVEASTRGSAIRSQHDQSVSGSGNSFENHVDADGMVKPSTDAITTNGPMNVKAQTAVAVEKGTPHSDLQQDPQQPIWQHTDRRSRGTLANLRWADNVDDLMFRAERRSLATGAFDDQVGRVLDEERHRRDPLYISDPPKEDDITCGRSLVAGGSSSSALRPPFTNLAVSRLKQRIRAGNAARAAKAEARAADGQRADELQQETEAGKMESTDGFLADEDLYSDEEYGDEYVPGFCFDARWP